MVLKNGIVVKCFLLLILLSCQVLPAQSYIADVRKLSIEDGLSNRFVNKIYKDSQGFIWIATRYGLNRYDGYSFKLYTTENSALSSSIIRDIHEDDQQRLWIVEELVPYSLNISILDLKTGNIQSFDRFFEGVTPFKSKDYTYLYSGTENDLWIATRKGTVYRYHNNRFEHIFTFPDQYPIHIFYADEQLLWVKALAGKSNEKLLKVNIKSGISAANDFQYNSGYTYTGTDKSTFWHFQPLRKKLLRFTGGVPNPKSIDLQSLELPKIIFDPDTDISRIFHSRSTDDLLWLYQREHDSSHLFVFHPRKEIILDLKPKIQELYTHGQFYTKSIYFETENKAWIATDDGVFIVSLKENRFTTRISGESENYSVRGITEDKKRVLYINTLKGRVQLDSKRGIIEKRKEGTVWLAASRDRRENLWFADDYHNIEKYDPSSGQSQYYTRKPGTSTPWTIIQDKTEQIWIGASRGLSYLEPEANHYQKFTRYNDFPELEKSAVYHLQEDKKGIWIASSSGLYLLEPGSGITARYASGEKSPYHIPYNHIFHFYWDTTGVFWLATKGGGLIRFDPATGNHRQFTTIDGLSSNIIYAVYEDDYGKLWLPSNYGLMQFDKKTYRVNTWFKDDGISHNEFNTISHYEAADGTLYFGGLDGVTVLHPKDFTDENTDSIPLRITGCRVLNGKTGSLTNKTTAVSNSEKLVLSPSDKSFIVEFALLNYRNTQQNSYTYTIEGLDKNWTSIRDNRLRVNALPYGNYTLRIKGQSLKGAQSAGELAILIVVRKPFYLQTWFLVAAILVLGLLVYGIFQWRLQSLRNAKIRLRQTVKQRTEEISLQKNKIEQQAKRLSDINITQSRWFTNIAHELRTPITLILGPIRQFLKAHPETPKTGLQSIQVAEKNSQTLLKLVNEILDISRLESSKLKLNRKPTNLNRLIMESVAHFESYATQKGVNLTIHVPENISLNIDKERIRNILVNLISNALKFTHTDGKVSISLINESGEIRIFVKDTGEGIPEKDLPHVFERYYQASHLERMNQGGTGIGLALSMELARLHGGNLSVESQYGKGSTFILHLPKSLVTEMGKTASGESKENPPGLLNTKTRPSSKKANKVKNKAHILLVEDNPDMRQYIRSFMADLYKVTEAGNGLEALEILKKITPDLIISDVMMPRMDGFQLLQKLRSAKATKNIAIIMLTARAGREDRLHALTIGVDDYLTKPFDEEELMARIRYSLRNRIKRQRWKAQLPDKEKETISADKKFLARAEEVVIKAIPNHLYAVTDMAEELSLGERQLFRKIKVITGLSPLQFIREIRLQKARSLLEAKAKDTVAEVAYAVGFQKRDYFARLYRERFGKLPSSYL